MQTDARKLQAFNEKRSVSVSDGLQGYLRNYGRDIKLPIVLPVKLRYVLH